MTPPMGSIPVFVTQSASTQPFEVWVPNGQRLDTQLEKCLLQLLSTGAESGECFDGRGQSWRWFKQSEGGGDTGTWVRGELIPRNVSLLPLNSRWEQSHSDITAWLYNQLKHDANNFATAVLGVATMLELKLSETDGCTLQVERLHRACQSYRDKTERFRVFQGGAVGMCAVVETVTHWLDGNLSAQGMDSQTWDHLANCEVPMASDILCLLLKLSSKRLLRLSGGSDRGGSVEVRLAMDESGFLQVLLSSSPDTRRQQGDSTPSLPQHEKVDRVDELLFEYIRFVVAEIEGELECHREDERETLTWRIPILSNRRGLQEEISRMGKRVVVLIGGDSRFLDVFRRAAEGTHLEIISVNSPSAANALWNVVGAGQISVITGVGISEEEIVENSSWAPLLSKSIPITIFGSDGDSSEPGSYERFTRIDPVDAEYLTLDEAREALGIDIVRGNQ